MRKYKVRMVISILVAIMLLLHMIVPMLSMADNEELNIELTKVEINGGYQINVTGSSPSKILALSYINDKKTIADFNSNAEAIIAYFEGENATKLNITSDNYINEVINVTNLGNYTVYLRNLDGEIQLAYITISDKAAITLEATSQETDDSKSILIKASSTSNITAVKVLKTDDATVPANFTNAANLLDSEKTPVEITYPIIENGIYQIYVEDANKNKKIQTVNVFEGESPISIQTTVNGTNVTINATDSIANIQTIKIAPKAEIASIADFETKGTNVNFEGTNNITTNYEVSSQGIYIVFVKDAAGNTFMKSVDITSTPEQSIQFYKLTNNESTIYAVATDSNNNINFAKYLFSNEEKTLEEVKNNGTQINVTEGKLVVLEISSSNIADNNFVSVYVRDSIGYGKMVGISIRAIQVVDALPNVPEQPTTPDVPVTPTEPEQPTTPDVPVIPTTPEQPTTPDVPVIPTEPEQPTTPDVPVTPAEPNQPTTPDVPVTPTEPTNPDGALNLDDIKNGDDDFEQIQDKTTINTTTTDSGIKIIDDNSASNKRYPQTGVNNYVLIAGIIVATGVAIVSYKKMKSEE